MTSWLCSLQTDMFICGLDWQLLYLSFSGHIKMPSQMTPINSAEKTQQSERASMVEMLHFPVDLIFDILSRLPVKPLLRFRCVSKPFCTLIDSPEFVKAHLKLSIDTNSNLNLILGECKLYSIDFDTLDSALKLDYPLKGTTVWASCNGLLCLCNTNQEVTLWNPSTRKHLELPVVPIDLPGCPNSFCWYIVYGFGYDPINDEYKVVRIVQLYGRNDTSFYSIVNVYSSKSNSWRRIQDLPYYVRYVQRWGVLAGGALHWVATKELKLNASYLIVAFDLKEEKYREVPQPEYRDGEKFYINLGVLGGCLSISCHYSQARVDMWVMKEYGVKESWTKLCSVSLPKGIKSLGYVRPLTYSKTGRQVLLERDNEKIMWYDLEKKTVEYIEVDGVPDSFATEICFGSLVDPHKCIAGVDEKQQTQEKKKRRKAS